MGEMYNDEVEEVLGVFLAAIRRRFCRKRNQANVPRRINTDTPSNPAMTANAIRRLSSKELNSTKRLNWKIEVNLDRNYFSSLTHSSDLI